MYYVINKFIYKKKFKINFNLQYTDFLTLRSLPTKNIQVVEDSQWSKHMHEVKLDKWMKEFINFIYLL